MLRCSIYIALDRSDKPPKGPTEMQYVNEFTKPWADMFAQNPLNPAAFSDASRKYAATGEAFAAALFNAAESSAELTGKWAMDNLARMKGVCVAKEDAGEYAQAAKDFASSYMESAAENIAAYAEIAKRAQVETTEIFLGGEK